jgi:hypothetical protein
VDQLSAPGQQRKLAADVVYLKQQAALINSAAVHIQQACHEEQACRQLLAQAPQMLRQLVVITTAVLQQLAVQRDSEVEVSRTAGLLVVSLTQLLPAVRGRPADIHTPAAPADTANLRMMQDTGGCSGFCALLERTTTVHSPAEPQHTTDFVQLMCAFAVVSCRPADTIHCCSPSSHPLLCEQPTTPTPWRNSIRRTGCGAAV